MDNITTSGNIGVEELKEESNLIIYIVGLILLIIWKVTMICQVRLHLKHNRLEKQVEKRLDRALHIPIVTTTNGMHFDSPN